MRGAAPVIEADVSSTGAAGAAAKDAACSSAVNPDGFPRPLGA